MIKYLINFFINWDAEITVSADITSSKQLVLAKTTYVNLLKIPEAKLWKKAFKNNLQ